MAIIVPDGASVFSTSQAASNIAGGANTLANHWCWFDFGLTGGASGCVMWMDGTASATASPIYPMLRAASSPGGLVGPFNPQVGIVMASMSGGCAILWFKTQR